MIRNNPDEQYLSDSDNSDDSNDLDKKKDTLKCNLPNYEFPGDILLTMKKRYKTEPKWAKLCLSDLLNNVKQLDGIIKKRWVTLICAILSKLHVFLYDNKNCVSVIKARMLDFMKDKDMWHLNKYYNAIFDDGENDENAIGLRKPTTDEDDPDDVMKLLVAFLLDDTYKKGNYCYVDLTILKLMPLFANSLLTHPKHAQIVKMKYHKYIFEHDCYQVLGRKYYAKIFIDNLYSDEFDISTEIEQKKLDELMIQYRHGLKKYERQVKEKYTYKKGQVVGARAKDGKIWASIVRDIHVLDGRSWYLVEFLGWGRDHMEFVRIPNIFRYNQKRHKCYVDPIL